LFIASYTGAIASNPVISAQDRGNDSEEEGEIPEEAIPLVRLDARAYWRGIM
jgi:hypothetical protein